ncbi:BZ3500_MvSof-1268-A1-R1_Chr11-2g03332 [Microbotryum saponariae]|uniref:BZ3500_MvSof-1268-A1-R1_Chr11-2g03332 protein n=1 Tax=Microbotryum saponariae TaxID=289078 RepID=A0A2X0MT30_9BASI|nr:BZ3500_MvSof-1268-A1-R1_Chr11-2g03332 [Microbotryum saponariae]SDA03143.1 BZ3501_MvSof-1269-A2-R1_Chr11g02903 [Microbotryum saponariae]
MGCGGSKAAEQDYHTAVQATKKEEEKAVANSSWYTVQGGVESNSRSGWSDQ